jgi:hypothetical protein
MNPPGAVIDLFALGNRIRHHCCHGFGLTPTRSAKWVGYRPVRTMRTANGVVFRKLHVGMPVRKNTTRA